MLFSDEFSSNSLLNIFFCMFIFIGGFLFGLIYEDNLNSDFLYANAQTAPTKNQPLVEATLRDISFYNAGDPAQTDSSPCIGAAGVDICKLVNLGMCVVARNDMPLGETFFMTGLSVLPEYQNQPCIVLDRINPKYKNRIDIARPKNENVRELGLIKDVAISR